MSDFTPAVQRAEEALDALLEYGIKPDAIRAALAAALDVEEMARYLLLEFDDYRCGDHLDEPWNYDTEEPCQDCARAQADKAMSVARTVRATILGGGS